MGPALQRARQLLRLPLLVLAAPFLVLSILLFCLLPRPASHRLGRWLGGLAYRFSARSRETALENLQQRLGLGQKSAERVAAASLMQAGAAIMDVLYAPRLTRRVVQRDLAVPEKTRRALDAIRAGQKGAVLAGCHFGNWEFENLAWPFLAPPAMVIFRPLRYPFYRWLFRRLRRRTGQLVIHRTGAIRRCRAHVEDGGLALIRFDVPVPPQAGAEPFDFFGLPTFTTMAPGRIAAETGAPLYLLYTLPLGMHRYRLMLEPVEPAEAPAGLPPEETARHLMRRLNEMLEARIREYPEGWAWWLKRWSIRPDDAPREEWPTYSHAARYFLPHGHLPRD